jgi:hypothetical protein
MVCERGCYPRVSDSKRHAEGCAKTLIGASKSPAKSVVFI